MDKRAGPHYINNFDTHVCGRHTESLNSWKKQIISVHTENGGRKPSSAAIHPLKQTAKHNLLLFVIQM